MKQMTKYALHFIRSVRVCNHAYAACMQNNRDCNAQLPCRHLDRAVCTQNLLCTQLCNNTETQ